MGGELARASVTARQIKTTWASSLNLLARLVIYRGEMRLVPSDAAREPPPVVCLTLNQPWISHRLAVLSPRQLPFKNCATRSSLP